MSIPVPLYKITAMPVGETLVPAAEIFWMTQLTGWLPLTFWAFLIEGGGRRALLNTGFPAGAAFQRLHDHWTTWARAATGEDGHVPVVQPEQRIAAALRARGIAPEEITDVFVTPLTSYATGGLDRFPCAKLHLSRRGWIDFHAPDPAVPQLPRDIVFPPEVLRYLVIDAADRLCLVPDETNEPLPGLRAWFCGAHHRSSMCLVVPTAAGRVALTDAIFYYRNYEERIPLGLSESLEEHYHLYARLARECDLVLPLYDPAVAHCHPSLVVG
jgi:glyoxylase-like metal-dependent hydrolase (beta-lactamase superfamily II)